METKLDVCWSKGHDWKGLGTNTGVIRGAGSQGESVSLQGLYGQQGAHCLSCLPPKHWHIIHVSLLNLT